MESDVVHPGAVDVDSSTLSSDEAVGVRKRKVSHDDVDHTDLEVVNTPLSLPQKVIFSSQTSDSDGTTRQRRRRNRKAVAVGREWKLSKLIAIEEALRADPVDLTSLQQLAIKRAGLLTDDVRQKVWPQLLKINMYVSSPRPVIGEVHSYRDYNQVVLDVNRCLRRFPPGIEERRRLALQDQLIFLIVRILMKHPELHYYQGYHDICITFLLAVGDELAFALVEQLSLSHLRDFMDVTMEKTTHMLNYLYPILGRVNSDLRDHMENAGVGTIFCLSWLITWFGHVLNDYRHIVRLYDFFLACHPLMPIYLAAAIVLYRDAEILEADCDMATLHSLLSKVPDDLPFEDLIVKTGDLFLQYPPHDLAAEVEELNKQGFMGLREPDMYMGPVSRQRSKELASKSKRPFASASSHPLVTFTPRWVVQRRSLCKVVLCTLTATAATALYSYMTHGDSLAFLQGWSLR